MKREEERSSWSEKKNIFIPEKEFRGRGRQVNCDGPPAAQTGVLHTTKLQQDHHAQITTRDRIRGERVDSTIEWDWAETLHYMSKMDHENDGQVTARMGGDARLPDPVGRFCWNGERHLHFELLAWKVRGYHWEAWDFWMRTKLESMCLEDDHLRILGRRGGDHPEDQNTAKKDGSTAQQTRTTSTSAA